MFNLAPPTVRSLELTKFGGLFTEADPRSLPLGASPRCHDCDFTVEGQAMRPGLSSPLSGLNAAYIVEWIKSAKLVGGLNQTLAQDSGGRLLEENLATPGTMSSFYSGILNGARAVSETVNQQEYIALSDLVMGQDQPRSWDGTNLDRVSQAGPGAPSSPPVAITPNYTISTIAEIYAAQSIDTVVWGTMMQTGTAPPAGNNIWFMGAGGVTTFLTGLNVGMTVYVSGLPGMKGQSPNGTYTVTGTGYFSDSNGNHQWFSVTTATANGEFIRGGAGGTYQITQAIIQMSSPIPPQNAVVGQKITITGTSVQAWNQVWPIAATPTEGQIAISATSLASNVATYTYSIVSGIAPGWQPNFQYPQASQIVSAAGDVWQITTPGTSGTALPAFATSPQTDGTATWTKQPGVHMTVIVFNTSNGNGIFNVQNVIITSATQTTFTVSITSPNIVSALEQGAAVSGSGTALVIDPGVTTLGTVANPIFGPSSGGNVLVPVSNVAAGQRYAVVLFQCRGQADYITPASPPVLFYTTGQTAQIQFNNLPIGPPNVIARIVAFTAANSLVGGPYYYIPNDVVIPPSAAALGHTQLINKTIVNDNVSTQLGPITISDIELLTGINVSEPGNNLTGFNQREIGEFVKPVEFSGRVFYLGERTKTDTLVNMTFDGGSVNGLPAGWTNGLGASTSLAASPIFGQSLRISNSTGSVLNGNPALAAALTLSQTAFQTAYQSPVIASNTAYSARVTAWATGTVTLVMEFYSPSLGQSWQFTVASPASTPTEYIGPFNNPLWQPVPSDLQFRVWPLNMAAGAVLNVDRMEVYPTNQPAYQLQTIGSYFENPEAVDSLTGPVSVEAWTSKALTNHFALKFTKKYYVTTESQTFSPVDVQGSEPDGWVVEPIANIGCCGPMAEANGPDYLLTADMNGVYVYDGGSHIKVSQEIQALWSLIYAPSIRTVWIVNDVNAQKFYVGIPMITPNFWLPNAAANSAPALPNVILVCSYLGAKTAREIAESTAVHVSAFTGNLIWRDQGRKWNPWQIPAAHGNFIARPDGSKELWLGQQGGISYCDPMALTDHGAAIPESYATFAFSDNPSEERLQLGMVRKVWGYASVSLEGSGKYGVTAYPETLSTPYSATQPAFTAVTPALDDQNVPFNVTGNRCFFQFDVDGQPGSNFSLLRVVAGEWPDPRIPVSGR